MPPHTPLPSPASYITVTQGWLSICITIHKKSAWWRRRIKDYTCKQNQKSSRAYHQRIVTVSLQSKSLLVLLRSVWPEFVFFAQSSYLVYFVLGILYYSALLCSIHTCSPVRRYRIRRRGRRFGYTWSRRWTSRCSPLARTHSRCSVRTPASLHSTARQWTA